MEIVKFEEWQKLDLRLAKVIAVEDVEGKEKLFKLQIDVGGQEKTLVAGLKHHYTREELLGKTIVVVNNLKPALIAGVESQGMLLAVKATEGYGLLTADKTVKPGAKVE